MVVLAGGGVPLVVVLLEGGGVPPEATVTGTAAEATMPWPSVTVITGWNEPAAVGVPVTAPASLIDRPGGRSVAVQW